MIVAMNPLNFQNNELDRVKRSLRWKIATKQTKEHSESCAMVIVVKTNSQEIGFPELCGSIQKMKNLFL